MTDAGTLAHADVGGSDGGVADGAGDPPCTGLEVGVESGKRDAGVWDCGVVSPVLGVGADATEEAPAPPALLRAAGLA